MRTFPLILSVAALVGSALASQAAHAQTMNQPMMESPPGQVPSTPGWAQSRVGIELSFLGPNSLVGGGVGYQPSRWIELMLWGGYNHATAAGTTSAAYAEASIGITTAMARARIWPMERHSVVVDTGFGITSYSMSASGHGTQASNFGDTLDYRRKGTPGLANIGVGYGYRSNSEFRIAVILGALVHTNKLNSGTVTSSGSFTELDRENLRTQLDDTSDKLTQVRAYFEVSIGFLF